MSIKEANTIVVKIRRIVQYLQSEKMYQKWHISAFGKSWRPDVCLPDIAASAMKTLTTVMLDVMRQAFRHVSARDYHFRGARPDVGVS